MALTNALVIAHAGTGLPQEFIKSGVQSGDESTYVNMGTSSTTSVVSDTLKVRISDKGKASEPHLRRKTHNLNRSKTVIGADGKYYTATVNTTVTLPGGSVFDAAHLNALVYDCLVVITNHAETAPGGTGMPTDSVSVDYIGDVRVLSL
jgi:hypothetical protein